MRNWNASGVKVRVRNDIVSSTDLQTVFNFTKNVGGTDLLAGFKINLRQVANKSVCNNLLCIIAKS